jgi:hypothetical protein
MKRTLTTDRLYSLGDFKNIRFTDTIEDLPEEVATNSEIISELKLLQLIQIEYTYRRYVKLISEYPYDRGIDIVLKELEAMRDASTSKLAELLKTNNGGTHV